LHFNDETMKVKIFLEISKEKEVFLYKTGIPASEAFLM